MRRCAVVLSMAVLALLALPACSESALDDASLGEEFTLSVGQGVAIAGEDLQVRFVELVSDSRCPTGATCIWAGEVSCLIELTARGSTSTKVLTQSGASSPAEDSVAGYDVTFDIQPYPELGKEMATKDYRLQLVITRTPA